MGIVDLTLQAIIERNIIEQNNEEFEELLIFYHFTQHDLNSFLDLYRFNKIETISLKAVVTPYNYKWKLKELIRRLKEERDFYQKKK